MKSVEKDQWFELGHIDQLKIEARTIKKCAADYFANHQDILAGKLRAMSLEMELRAKQMRQDYDAKYPKNIKGKEDE